MSRTRGSAVARTVRDDLLEGVSSSDGRLETMSDAIARLARIGYGDSFQARGGALYALSNAQSHAPEDLCVREIVRFEGESDPGDSAVLFALRSRDGGTRGTLVAGYGTSSDPETAAVVARLDAQHAPETRARERRSASPRP